jgi:hypothetical protein
MALIRMLFRHSKRRLLIGKKWSSSFTAPPSRPRSQRKDIVRRDHKIYYPSFGKTWQRHYPLHREQWLHYFKLRRPVRQEQRVSRFGEHRSSRGYSRAIRQLYGQGAIVQRKGAMPTSQIGIASMNNASRDRSSVVALVATLLFCCLLFGCDAIGPWRRLISKVRSPDGAHVAELTEEDSVGTGGVWTTIRIGRAGSYATTVVYSIQGTADNTVVRWNGPGELFITDPKLATAQGHREVLASYDGIRIRATAYSHQSPAVKSRNTSSTLGASSCPTETLELDQETLHMHSDRTVTLSDVVGDWTNNRPAHIPSIFASISDPRLAAMSHPPSRG